MTTPIILPITMEPGMGPIQYCMLMIVNLGMGLITPPVGGTLFIGSAISGIGVEKGNFSMKVLILGGTGVISRSIVDKAIDRGFEVTAVNRGSRQLDVAKNVRTITADRKDASAFAAALAHEKPDVVIDMIAFNAEDAKQTVELFRDRAAQIIVTSSIAAYARPYKSLPIREDAESLLAGSDFAYGQLKADMERYLTAEMNKPGAAITIIRPSLTFGPGARNFGMLRQNYNVVQRIKDGKPLVMVGEGVIPWCFTYAEDLAYGFVLACGNERTYNDCFHVVSDEMVVWEDIYRFVGELVGKEPILYNIPSALLREADPAVATHLNVEKVYCSVFSTGKFRKAAPDFKTAWKFKDGLARVIASWEEDKLGVDEAKNAQEDYMCGCWEAFRDNLLKKK
jgi:Nucleoside-diphosphate-sugar epimerases